MQDAIITAEQIKAVPELADLPEDKITKLVTLANNAGKQAIDTYSGTSKRRWEEDVKTLTGLEKPESGMPAHEFLKWAWSEKMKEVDDLKKKADGTKEKELTEQIAALQKKIESGSSAWKQEAEDYKSLVEQLKGQMKKVQDEYTEKLTAKEKENLLIDVQYALASVESGKEFDPVIPDDVKKSFLENRRNAILSNYTPERVQKDGTTVIQWRDKNGELVRIAEKGMEPATTADLYEKELAPILKKTKQQPGGGTTPPGGGKSTSPVDVKGAKTQAEAMRLIQEELAKQGLQKGTVEFTEEQNKIWKENELAKLPMR